MNLRTPPTSQPSAGARGFTLLELLVAVTAFVIISGAALSLFSYQQPVFNRQQNLAALNIAVRNAISQIELDVVNAGTGYYPGTDIPDWPVGVTMVNSNPTSACNTPSTYTYSSTCFDTLNIITTDPNTPPSHPDNGTYVGGTSDCIVTTTSPIYVLPPSGTTAATLASDYHNGDELLLVDSANSKITTILLTEAPTTYTSGSTTGVKLTFAVTQSTGVNTSTDDPLSITTCLVSTTPCPSGDYNTKLNTSFCATDWILRLQPITYQVSTTNSADPQLTRTQAGTTSVLADQIIGFKVGAVAWNVTDDTIPYSYVSSNNDGAGACSTQASSPVGYCNQWWLVRSVQVSLIGRTTPVTDPTYTYRNGFDYGPYQIESAMITVNPRNLSMNGN